MIFAVFDDVFNLQFCIGTLKSKVIYVLLYYITQSEQSLP